MLVVALRWAVSSCLLMLVLAAHGANQRPAIQTQPQSQTVVVGSNVTFSVSATSGTPMQYQWNFNGTNIAGATNQILSLTNVQPTDAGNYAVDVTNDKGTTSSSTAVLTVLVPPSITAQPVDETVNWGASTNLSVTASGTAPLSYQWFFQGVRLTNATNATLSLPAVQSAQAGGYFVMITNQAGAATSRVAVVSVNCAPVINLQPQSQTVLIGSNATLTVTAQGPPLLTYQWSWNGTNLTGATNATLLLSNMQLAQAGSYAVLVSNACGLAQSSNAVLTAVTVLPIIVTSTRDDGSPGTLRWAITNANQASGLQYITFNIAGTAPFPIALSSDLPTIQKPMVIDGTTQPGYAGIPIVGLAGWSAHTGLHVTGGGCTIRGLVFYGLQASAIVLEGNGSNIIQGNFIGTQFAGTEHQGNLGCGILITNSWGNTIGGTNAGARNLVSAGNSDGLRIMGRSATNNQVQGNFIGTDVTGTVELGNIGNGITLVDAGWNLIGGPSPAARNIIAWENLDGIQILGSNAQGNVIQGNFIGTDVTGSASLRNVGAGIRVSGGTNNWIGGTNVGAGNLIEFNGKQGVVVAVGDCAILGNSIFGNVGLAIDLGGTGVTPNDPGDADTGPNGLQNFPMLTNAVATPNATYVQGKLNSTSNTMFRIEFFANAACDSGGYGGGQIFLGFTNAVTDASGNGCFTAALPATGLLNQVITATATGPGNDTSEFSPCVTVVRSGPDINTQPQSQSVLANGTATFSVSASGLPPVNYQWSLNGTNVPGATNATLSLTNVQPAQAGTYVVTIWNVWAGVVSTPALLTVNVPAFIISPPLAQSVPAGSNAVFQVIAGGTGPLSYQWRVNGTNLAGATNAILALSNVQPSQMGAYSVAVSNPYGTTNSLPVNLLLGNPPRILVQPQPGYILVSHDVQFTVVADGDAPLAYQWQFNGGSLAGATNATLTLTNLQVTQAGSYAVLITNRWGSLMSAPALLTVVLPISQDLVVHLTFDRDLADSSGRGNDGTAVGAPNIIPGFIGSGSLNVYSIGASNNYISLGTPTDLCFAAHTDFSVAFWVRLPTGAWGGDPRHSDPVLLGNQDWTSGNNTGWTLAPGSDGRLQWSYREAHPNHLITYSGPAGSFGDPAWHHVAVVFDRGSNAMTYFDGMLVDTSPLGKGGTTLDSGLPINIGNDGTGSYPVGYGYWTNVAGNPTNGLGLDDLGIWRRALTFEEIGAIYNAGQLGDNLATVTAADLSGKLPPRIMQQPMSQEAVIGADATFAVVATGSQPLLFQWRFNDTPIQGETNQTLTLTNVVPANAGDYSVNVVNDAGTNKSDLAHLTVVHLPQQEWAVRRNGTGKHHFDSPQAVRFDAAGNYFVTGYAESPETGQDYVTIKYATNGQVLWTALYNGPDNGNDQARALALDHNGNAYVTGRSESAAGGWDYLTVKYDPNGRQVWTARYDGSFSGEDDAVALAVDAAGNVYVTGASQSAKDRYAFATVKYDPDGAQLWVACYVGPGQQEDRATSMALDASGNVYVSGKSTGTNTGFDFATLKYDGAGNQLWVARYDGPAHGTDEPVQVVLDASGNAIVTGRSEGVGTGFDYATVKYDPKGAQLWVARYDGPEHGADQPAALAVDAYDNAIVTGSSTLSRKNVNYATLKYDPNGQQLWQAGYGGSGQTEDIPYALALDPSGNVYVTGSSESSGSGLDYGTVKYTTDGVQCWVARYNGPANGDDTARGIVVDHDDNVVVTGESEDFDQSYDLVTVKYFQPKPPTLVTHPLAQGASLGGVVSFHATAVGAPPFYYQWTLNGANIPGATNDTYTITNVQATNAGNYQVWIINAAGAVESQAAPLQLNLPPLTLTNNFSDRVTNSALNGVGVGSNIGATREPGEPHHAGKIGTHSVWLCWRAPASGIVTFSTAGSDFDTLLAVYTGNSVTNLTSVAGDDDSGGYYTSKVMFNAVVGTEYQIAIDGLKGAAGNIVLSWNLGITDARIPVITSMPGYQTVGFGQDTSFCVGVDQTNVSLQWFWQGSPIAGETNTCLVVSNVQPEKVGLYYVKILAGTNEVRSQPAPLQINDTDGTVDSSAAAFDKFADLPIVSMQKMRSTPKTGGAGSAGYTGTQVFSTYGAGKEPDEPDLCGIHGGASVWYDFQAPMSGTMIVDTDGSTFDTVLAIYTGPGTDFASLVPVACDNNSGSNGLTSKVTFQATAGTIYWIAVDGVNGAQGTVQLNIKLGVPAAILTQPQSQAVPSGTNLTLNVSASGSIPYGYQWRFQDIPIRYATNATFTISNAQPKDSGPYTVVVSNLIAMTRSIDAIITVAQTISPGGSLNVAAQTESGGVTLNPGGNYTWEIKDAAGVAGSGFDLLSVPGTNSIDVQANTDNRFAINLVSLSGASAGPAANFNPNNSFAWTIATAGGGVLNFASNKFVVNCPRGQFQNDLAGGVFSVARSSDGKALNLVFTPNHAPTASNALMARSPGATLKIQIADLLARFASDPDGDAPVLQSVDATSALGGAVTSDGTNLYYTLASDRPDSFSYTVRDARSTYRPGDTVRTARALIGVTVSGKPESMAQTIRVADGKVTMDFAGLPGFLYQVQRSTDFSFWIVLLTTNMPPGGSLEYQDGSPPAPAAFYRLVRP